MGESLDGVQRQHGARVLELVAAVVPADNTEASAGDRELYTFQVVACERLSRPRESSLDQDEPVPDELVRCDAEDEVPLVREQLQLRNPGHAADRGDAAGDRLRQQRAAEVRDVSLEEAKVRTADVDQLVGAVLDAGRKR